MIDAWGSDVPIRQWSIEISAASDDRTVRVYRHTANCCSSSGSDDVDRRVRVADPLAVRHLAEVVRVERSVRFIAISSRDDGHAYPSQCQ